MRCITSCQALPSVFQHSFLLISLHINFILCNSHAFSLPFHLYTSFNATNIILLYLFQKWGEYSRLVTDVLTSSVRLVELLTVYIHTLGSQEMYSLSLLMYCRPDNIYTPETAWKSKYYCISFHCLFKLCGCVSSKRILSVCEVNISVLGFHICRGKLW